MLSLSLKPCSDGNNVEDMLSDDLSINHNHQEDSDDSCPVTCFCNCCGMSLTYESIKTFSVNVQIEISTTTCTRYQANYRFNFLSNIWQPPQLIS